MSNKCPNCNKRDFIHDTAIRYTECYGGGTHIISCIHCKAPVRVHLTVGVIINPLDVDSTRNLDDWNHECIIPKEKTA